MNLIITCARHLEIETQDEIKAILKELGDEAPGITITDMPGILTVTTQAKPLEVVEKMREKIIEEPWSIRYSLRIIPIQGVTTTSIDKITAEASKLMGVIKPQDSYRITIEKRNSDISTQKIISEIAKKISNKVSLEKPDWIILIEIIGMDTGVAVLKNESILSIQKTKRTLSN